MDDKEAARKKAEPIVVSLHPDVCKSPTAPAAYPITATFSTATQVATTVRATKVPTFTMASLIPGVQGDEAGTGFGLKSGTHAAGGMCWPTGSSSTVRAEKQLMVRHGDPMAMNGGNTDGKVNYQPGSGPRARVDEATRPTGDTKAVAPPETPQEKGFWAGVGSSASEAWSGLKGQAGTLWDATGITAAPEAVSAARGAIWEGTKNVAALGRDVGLAVTPGVNLTPWGQEAIGRLGDTASAVGGQIKDRYVSAYNEGGALYALGVGTGDLGKLGVEALGAKGVGLVAKGAGLGRALGAADNVADVAANAKRAESALDVATDGASLTNKVDEVGALGKVDDVPEAPTNGVRIYKEPIEPPDRSKVKYPDDVEQFKNADGEWDWDRVAPNKGFAGDPVDLTLTENTIIDRFGDGGRYFSPVGTPFDARALAPDSLTAPYHAFRVLKDFPVKAGEIASAFGQPGGGTQFLSTLGNADKLVELGYLGRIPP